jgi:hypothetical protein
MNRLVLLSVLGICIFARLEAQTAQSTSTGAQMPAQMIRSKMINPYGLTPAEMHELDLARQEALKADPDLAQDSVQLKQKLRDFQFKLDQAILAADPNVAPVVARIERGPGAQMPVHLPPSISTPPSQAFSTPPSH